jgi:hypothetical protein
MRLLSFKHAAAPPRRGWAGVLAAALALAGGAGLRAAEVNPDPHCIVGADRCPTKTIERLVWYVTQKQDLVEVPGHIHELPGPVLVSGCAGLDLEFEIPADFLATLNPGFWYLYVQAVDAENGFSEPVVTIFEKPAPIAPTGEAKLFIDQDPLEIEPGSPGGEEVTLVLEDCAPESSERVLCAEFELDPSSLEPGSHRLHLSLEDATGFWTVPFQASFLVEYPNSICPPSLLVDRIFGETSCSDGIDNDGDGLADAADPECPDPASNADVLLAPSPDPCFPGFLCFEGTITPADFPQGRGWIEFCADRGYLGGLWIDVLGQGRHLSVFELPEETATQVTLTPRVPDGVIQIRVPPGGTVVLDLADDNPNHSNAIFARFGAPPTDTEYDRMLPPGETSGGRLVVTSSSPEEQILYIRIRGDDFPGGSSYVVTVTGDVVADELVLESVTPAVGTAGGKCDLAATIRGAHFEKGPIFVLRHSDTGTTAVTCSRTIVSSERAEVVFDLEGKPLGLYDLIATAGGAEEMLPSAFRAVEPVKGMLLEAEIAGPDAARLGQPGRLVFRFRNAGDEAMDAPLFAIRSTSPGVRLKLDRDADYSGSEIVALAGLSASGRHAEDWHPSIGDPTAATPRKIPSS